MKIIDSTVVTNNIIIICKIYDLKAFIPNWTSES